MELTKDAQEVIDRGIDAARNGKSIDFAITCAISDVTSRHGHPSDEYGVRLLMSEIVKAYIIERVTHNSADVRLSA